jgi:hypothetical protein
MKRYSLGHVPLLGDLPYTSIKWSITSNDQIPFGFFLPSKKIGTE